MFVVQFFLTASSTAHSLNVAHLVVRPFYRSLPSMDSTLHCVHNLLLVFLLRRRSRLLLVRDAESLEKVTLVLLDELCALFAESMSECFGIFVTASVREDGRKACS